MAGQLCHRKDFTNKAASGLFDSVVRDADCFHLQLRVSVS